MKKIYTGLLASLAVTAAAAAPVNVSINTTANYAATDDYTACATAANLCVNFPANGNVTGTFRIASDLPANASNLEVGSLVTSYSFSSGADVIASTDANARLNTVRVSTDASGTITSVSSVEAMLWLTGSAPHSAGARYSLINTFMGIGTALHNLNCTNVGTAPSRAADSCTASSNDSSRSRGRNAGVSFSYAPDPTPAPTPTPVPTLSQWGLMALSAVLALAAMARRRRHR